MLVILLGTSVSVDSGSISVSYLRDSLQKYFTNSVYATKFNLEKL